MTRSAALSLPAIPDQFWPINPTSLSEHCLLTPADRCYYLWEYAPYRRYDFSPANQLIRNLKIRPSVAACSPTRARYKRQAIAHAAAALRHLISREFVEARATFVPIPGIDSTAWAALFRPQGGCLLATAAIFSGGGIRRMAVFALSVTPYLSAAIFLQLLSIVVTPLRSLARRGEQLPRSDGHD